MRQKYGNGGDESLCRSSVSESEVKFSFENVSEQQLNSSADELDRSIYHGDISGVRVKEGTRSFTIAKSLTESKEEFHELY